MGLPHGHAITTTTHESDSPTFFPPNIDLNGYGRQRNPVKKDEVVDPLVEACNWRSVTYAVTVTPNIIMTWHQLAKFFNKTQDKDRYRQAAHQVAEMAERKHSREEDGEVEDISACKRFRGLSPEAEELIHLLEDTEEEESAAEEEIVWGVMKSLQEEIANSCCSTDSEI
ncbi:hypothetical protein SUGI_1100800 [Cryptomeria japonica]|nr:hypothetical protein SUGI_1100800 [Cryptomeria japonica]